MEMNFSVCKKCKYHTVMTRYVDRFGTKVFHIGMKGKESINLCFIHKHMLQSLDCDLDYSVPDDCPFMLEQMVSQ